MKKYFFSICLCTICLNSFSQHQHSAKVNNRPKLEFNPVLTQILSDPELKNYKMDAISLTVPVNYIDTVSHRHDAELFGYVVEGEVEIGMEKAAGKTYKAGQMFYEQRNSLHSLLQNKQKKPARVLLIFIIKEGREAYKKEY